LVALYDEMARLGSSPIVELNRAVAVSMTDGPDVALAFVDALVQTRTLERYPLLYGVRGDLLDRLVRCAEAAEEFDQAAALSGNTVERDLCAQRAASARARTNGRVTDAHPA
jgi:predicted RNA polymerase sigma factor